MMGGAVAWAWSIRKLDPATRLVLLSLAGRANNTTYECFPSLNRLAADAEVSKSTVQRALKRLEDRGVILIYPQARENGSDTVNRYKLAVSIDYRHPDGETVHEGSDRNGSQPSATGRNGVVKLTTGGGQIDRGAVVTGDYPLTPHKELTSTKPSVSPKSAKAYGFAAPPGVSIETWRDFLKIRNGNRCPMTETAYKRLLPRLVALNEQYGATPEDTIAQSVDRGWRGVFPPEVDYDKGGNNGRRTAQPGMGRFGASADGLSTTARAAMEAFGFSDPS